MTSALPTSPAGFQQAASTIESSLADIWHSFLAHLPQLAAGFLVLCLVALASRISRSVLTRVLRRTRLRRSLRELLARLFHIGLWILGLLLAAMIVFPGLTPTKALSGLGIASVAIGFAFKDIFENFFAGVLILWRFPFDNGDFIECGDLMGRVEEITIRNTLIRRPTGELVVVPNSRLFTEPVEVLTDQSARRMSLVCGIGYGENVKQAVRVIRSAVERCKTLVSGYPVEVLAKGFGPSSVDLEITWWAQPEPGQMRQSRNEVLGTVKGALDASGIEIPFPQRTLSFSSPLRLDQPEAAEAVERERSPCLPG